MCPSLTLQQIYKLSEHHHDDWITAVGDNQGTKTIVLLETLKRAVDSSGGMATPPPAPHIMSADGVPQTPYSPGGGPNPYPSPGSVSSMHQFEDEDNLLLDSQVVNFPCCYDLAMLKTGTVHGCHRGSCTCSSYKELYCKSFIRQCIA